MVGAAEEEARGRVRWRLWRPLKGVAKKKKQRSKEPGPIHGYLFKLADVRIPILIRSHHWDTAKEPGSGELPFYSRQNLMKHPLGCPFQGRQTDDVSSTVPSPKDDLRLQN